MRRVLIIHTDGNTFNNPSLKSVVDLLLSKGVLVDITYPAGRAPMPAIKGINQKPWGRLVGRIKNIINDKLCSWHISRLYSKLEYLSLKKDTYDLVIAVDRIGLIEAAHLKSFFGVPFVFFSFEIMFESETSKRFKVLERKASHEVSHWFVQDEVRAACLVRENGLVNKPATIIPLASAGLGVKSKDRLRDFIGVPARKKVAILIGSLSQWTQADEIICSALNWPEDWVLIVHDRYGATSAFISKLADREKISHSQRVYFSDFASEMVDDLGFVLAGTDVGLAFYKPKEGSPYTGKNLSFIGLASGKIASYLRYGIPVITNQIGQYADLAVAHNFGVVVKGTSEINNVLDSRFWEEKGLNAETFFLKRLDFRLYENEVWDILTCHSNRAALARVMHS